MSLLRNMGLNGVLQSYSNIAQNSANNNESYTDFLEKILEEEWSIRKFKGKQMLESVHLTVSPRYHFKPKLRRPSK